MDVTRGTNRYINLEQRKIPEKDMHCVQRIQQIELSSKEAKLVSVVTLRISLPLVTQSLCDFTEPRVMTQLMTATLACSRLSVRGDDRKSGRATSGYPARRSPAFSIVPRIM